MLLNPYLQYNGQCEAAFNFYEKCLGGKIAFKITYGESPMADQTPSEFRGKIMHMRLIVGDKILMGSDAPAGRYEKPQGFSVSLGIETPEEAERIFKALSEKGKVAMPLEETFWARRFGMLVDPFGIPWMINCEKAS
jgi:PhnB protein